MPDLVPFYSGLVENFYFLVLGQVQMIKVNKILYFHILISYYKFIRCIENSVDPDQLASSTLFTRELIFGFILFLNCLSTERYLANLYYRTSKLFFGQVHYCHLLVPGQVENFTISTPLIPIAKLS